MNRLFAAVILSTLIVGVCAMELVGQARDDVDKKTKKRAEGFDRAGTLIVLVDSAREAYEAHVADYEAGTTTMENIYTWSNRWRAAAVKGAGGDKDKTLQANTDHLERMKELHRKIKALHDAQAKGGEASKFRATKYYAAEAELFVAEPAGVNLAIRDK